jgi:D-beta-D-heptose 7-phosphate kinase/D-beta-D-heptose 1-phosphate adenosyltransferase
MVDLKSIQQLAKFNILLIGDSCIDEYKIGTVDRLSPEAPIPVVKIIREYRLPGMSANVKLNFNTLGVSVDFITNNETIIKTRYIDDRSGQHLLRVDDEQLLIPWSTRPSFQLSSYDAIVISDYNKGFLSYETIAWIIQTATCPVFIDTKKTQLEDISAGHVYFKINELEYKNARSLPSNLIVTLGDRGALYKTVQQEIIIPTGKVDVMDVCGCGDTFLAALVCGFLVDGELESAIMFANTAAGITVQHRGNYAPTIEEILNA